MRPIDVDALIDFIDIGHLRNPLEACYSERDVVDMLESRPTLTLDDLMPKGRWLERYGVSEYKYECSVCNMSSDLMTDFCPNCGADMRGGADA